MLTFRCLSSVALILALISAPLRADAQIVQFSGAPVAAACSSSVLDAFAASPGAWTATYSMRQLRAAYAGKSLQLQRTSDSTTLDIGFGGGCAPDTTSSAAFCSTAMLSVGAASSRIAFPTGSVIHVLNAGPSAVFYASGNGSVTATTGSSPLMFNQGVNITVGANTNIAALVGAGYGINGNAGAATLFLTNCGASKVYDQSGNTNDVAQTTAADQLGYYPSCQNGFPCLFGCLSGCNLHAADSATYKTATVEAFVVMTFGEDITTANFAYNAVGYPTTTNSAASDFRWGLSNAAQPDVLGNSLNGSDTGFEGFGGIWRGQNITQYDYSTGGVLRWNGGTQFMSTGSGTPTYPNAVGLYLMGDSAGGGTPGMFVEALVASGTQTARNSISANQVSYWGITTGTAASSALNNPLGDGWNWNRIQLGGFAPTPPGVGAITVNGSAYFSEASWNNYTQWQATNGSTTGGRLGDNWRFQISGLADAWDGTNRSEVDGAGSAQFSIGATFWISYAVYIEPGTAYTSQWNINGQMHTVAGGICCIFNTMSNSNSVSDTWFVYTNNATTATQSSATTGVPITRGRWYHFVYQVGTSTTGTNDTFNVWLDTVTEGTMVQIASHTGASLFGGNGTNNAAYWKYGIYRETGNNLPTFAVLFANMQVCSQGADCMAKYGVSDLSALETTPLPDPMHQ